jgi:hypothetical protein
MNPNSEAIYDAEINPLVAKIIDLCRLHKIPMVASFQFADATHPRGLGFCTTRLPFDGESPKLDTIARFLMDELPPMPAIVITTNPPGETRVEDQETT